MTIRRLGYVAEHVVWHDLPRAVIAIGMLGIEHLQAIADCDAGGDDQECPGEPIRAGGTNGVERLPGYDHRHHCRFPGARCHLQRKADEFGVCLGVGGLDRSPEMSMLPPGPGDLSQPNQRLDRLDLAEKRLLIVELMVPPMFEQALRGR